MSRRLLYYFVIIGAGTKLEILTKSNDEAINNPLEYDGIMQKLYELFYFSDKNYEIRFWLMYFFSTINIGV